MTIRAKLPSCLDLHCIQALQQPHALKMVVGLGIGGRAFCPPGCPAGCTAPASPVCNFSSLPGAALCLVWSIRWDHSPCCHGCRFFIFQFISTREYRTLAGHRAQREVKGFMWVRVDQYLNQSPPACLWELCLHWWGAGASCPQSQEEDRCLRGGNEMHLPQLPPKSRREIIGFKMSPFILGECSLLLRLEMRQGWKY